MLNSNSTSRAVWLIAVIGALSVTACGDDGSTGTTSSTTEPVASTTATEPPASTSATDAPEVSASSPSTTAAEASTTAAPTTAASAIGIAESNAAAWQKFDITDVDGTTFRLTDLAGKPVFVEFFATWCSNCKAQLVDTQAAAAAAGDAATVVAISVETDIDAADVAEYAADNGFTNIRFAVATAEHLAAVTDDLGNSAINPPATPKVSIDAEGRATEVKTGPESVEEITSALGL